MYFVYALKFVDDRIYIGMTNGPKRRFMEHRNGKTKSTKNRGEFTAIYIEKHDDRITARKREKYWKSGIGKETLKSRTGT